MQFLNLRQDLLLTHGLEKQAACTSVGNHAAMCHLPAEPRQRDTPKRLYAADRPSRVRAPTVSHRDAGPSAGQRYRLSQRTAWMMRMRRPQSGQVESPR